MRVENKSLMKAIARRKLIQEAKALNPTATNEVRRPFHGWGATPIADSSNRSTRAALREIAQNAFESLTLKDAQTNDEPAIGQDVKARAERMMPGVFKTPRAN